MEYLKDIDRRLTIIESDKLKDTKIIGINQRLRSNLDGWNHNGSKVLGRILTLIENMGMYCFITNYNEKTFSFNCTNKERETVHLSFSYGEFPDSLPRILVTKNDATKIYECGNSFRNCLFINLVGYELVNGFTKVYRSFDSATTADIKVSNSFYDLTIKVAEEGKKKCDKFILPREKEFLSKLLQLELPILLEKVQKLLIEFFDGLISLDSFKIILEKKKENRNEKSLVYSFAMESGIVTEYTVVKKTASGTKVLVNIRRDGVLGFSTLADNTDVPILEAADMITTELVNVRKLEKSFSNRED